MKILVVDDIPENVYMLESLFRGSGHAILTARNGEEALRRLRDEGADLVVSDILMPVMDGFQLCRAVRADEALRGIPFVFYTATYTDPKDCDFAMSLGADRFLVKPMEPADLLRSIDEVAAARRAAPEGDIAPSHAEEEFLRRHNETLFRKLNDKISDLEKANAKTRRDEARLECLLRIAQARFGSTQEMLDRALREALVLTGSQIGYLFRYDEGTEHFSLSGWAQDDKASYPIPEPSFDYELARTGLWGEAVRRRKPILLNDLRTENSLRHGMPEGHARLERFLTVPVLRHGYVVAVLGVADKPADYNETDARQLTLLMDTIWGMAERTQMERTIRESEKRFSDLMESVSLATLIVSSAGVVTFCNSFLLGMAGRTASEAVGGNWLDLFVPASQRASQSREIDAVAGTGAPRKFEGEVLTLGEKRRLVAWNACALRDGEGRITAVALVGFDVTDHRIVEEQLRQSQKMEALGTMAGGVAHDFNNVLTVILGCASLLKMGLEKSSKNESLANEIVASVERASEMTRSLLAFSRKQPANLFPWDINVVLVELKKSLKRLIREDIEFRATWHDHPVPVLLDRGQIEQVIVNLVVNARDAMPSGGVLSIATSTIEVREERDSELFRELRPGRYGVLTISDTGVGMDAETQKRAFEPFFTTKEQGKGTGLGLSIVYGIVTQHGGYIHLYSEKDWGTTFRVYLPLLPEGEEVPVVTPEAEIPRGTGTILLVEDEEAVRKITGTILESNGYRVLYAGDGEAGLAAFEENRDTIALVLSDLVMPRMNGRQMYDRICRVTAGVPVVFMSGYPDNLFSDGGGKDAPASFLQKPLSPGTLLRTVGDAIRRSGKETNA
ncbi:MAG TPA: response regulator [Candidatus Deferrimicrobiaceae bacterium]|jgi:PAS domain S-box-containing protein